MILNLKTAIFDEEALEFLEYEHFTRLLLVFYS